MADKPPAPPAKEPLQPDQDAVRAWDELPKGAPSRQALPPLTGGSRWLNALLIAGIIILLLVLLTQGR
jgi:hypothetical protein